jgi:hypothetical protein
LSLWRHRSRTAIADSFLFACLFFRRARRFSALFKQLAVMIGHVPAAQQRSKARIPPTLLAGRHQLW